MKTWKAFGAREAYRRGYRATPEDFDKAREQFQDRYCDHGYSGQCDLCIAYWNGYDNAGNHTDKHEHVLKCPLGVSDRGNHEDCDY